jgi:hypothetical protein
MNFEKMSVSQLKDWLKAKGCVQSGEKGTLIFRHVVWDLCVCVCVILAPSIVCVYVCLPDLSAVSLFQCLCVLVSAFAFLPRSFCVLSLKSVPSLFRMERVVSYLTRILRY